MDFNKADTLLYLNQNVHLQVILLIEYLASDSGQLYLQLLLQEVRKLLKTKSFDKKCLKVLKDHIKLWVECNIIQNRPNSDNFGSILG